jgi:CRP-like cAMP-binding protein
VKATLTKSATVDQFLTLFKEGYDAWVKAGEVLVELIDANPQVIDEILDRYPDINAGVLRQFEKLGRKQLHPLLLLESTPGESRLARLPYSEQVRHIDKPVEIIVETDAGPDTMQVETKHLTRLQSEQVFAKDHVRSLAEQRAWLMDRRERSVTDALQTHPWRIVGKNQVEVAGVRLTRKQVLEILKELRT